MLLASPQPGLMDWLRSVICFQLAVGPAQTSGGVPKELRITAEDFRSRESERLMPHAPAVSWLASRNSSVLVPSAGLIVATPESPSRYSPKIRFSSGVHASQLAEAFISGVMFRASPPVAAMVKMSPPTEGSSLIRPPMKAMRWQSGDQTGLAIWSGGL